MAVVAFLAVLTIEVDLFVVLTRPGLLTSLPDQNVALLADAHLRATLLALEPMATVAFQALELRYGVGTTFPYWLAFTRHGSVSWFADALLLASFLAV